MRQSSLSLKKCFQLSKQTRPPLGTFAQKYKNCEICDFYKQVKQEEAHQFVLSAVLLSKMRGK